MRTRASTRRMVTKRDHSTAPRRRSSAAITAVFPRVTHITSALPHASGKCGHANENNLVVRSGAPACAPLADSLDRPRRRITRHVDGLAHARENARARGAYAVRAP